MAQPSSGRRQYLGSVKVKGGEPYLASDFTTLFTNANMFMLKSRQTTDKPIKVSINKTPEIEIIFNESNYFDGTTALKYVFNQDCLVAVMQEF